MSHLLVNKESHIKIAAKVYFKKILPRFWDLTHLCVIKIVARH